MGVTNYPNKILVVDRDRSIGKGMAAALEKYKIKVDVASDRETAVYLFNQNIYPVVLIEIDFPDIPGIVLLQKFRANTDLHKSSCGAILLEGGPSGRSSKKLKLLEEMHNVHSLNKPIKPINLLPLLMRSNLARNTQIKGQELYQSIYNLSKSSKGADKAIELAKSSSNKLGLKSLDMVVDILAGLERWDEALEFVEGQLAKLPNNSKLLNDKSKILLKQGKTKQALEIMELLDKVAPQNIERINSLAQLYLEMQQPDSSVRKMREMIDFNPEDESLKFSLFSKLSDMGYDDHANQLCRETASPIEVVRHYNNKGVALAKEGNVEGAIMEYERSLQFYPSFKQNFKIMYNLALALTSFKTVEHHSNALEHLENCLKLSPSYEKAQRTKPLVEEQLVKLRLRAHKAS